MIEEKNLLNKVQKRLEKKNILIMKKRWDEQDYENDFIEKVREKKMEREVEFIVKELNV